MNRILVPTDFSKITENAMSVAINIAERFDAEVFLLNIIEPIIDAGFSAIGTLDFEYTITEEDRFVYELHKVNEKRLAAFGARYYSDKVNLYPTIAIDKVGDGILDFIRKYRIDLVVMGTSGENSFEEIFIGNHTEQVMRDAHCPVLCVRNQIADFHIKNVVIATDLRSNAHEGMTYLHKILSCFEPEVHLVHVTKSNSVSIHETREKLNEFAKNHNIDNFTVNAIQASNLKTGIQRFATDMKADMIVAFTHGRKGFSHLIKGSISEDLVKQARMPVLSIHLD